MPTNILFSVNSGKLQLFPPADHTVGGSNWVTGIGADVTRVIHIPVDAFTMKPWLALCAGPDCL